MQQIGKSHINVTCLLQKKKKRKKEKKRTIKREGSMAVMQ